MALPVDAYRSAAREGRWFDAATDPALHALWKEKEDPLARALLILAAAHLHAANGNREGAVAKLERAGPYLDAAPADAFTRALREHADARRAQVRDGDLDWPPVPV